MIWIQRENVKKTVWCRKLKQKWKTEKQNKEKALKIFVHLSLWSAEPSLQAMCLKAEMEDTEFPSSLLLRDPCLSLIIPLENCVASPCLFFSEALQSKVYRSTADFSYGQSCLVLLPLSRRLHNRENINKSPVWFYPFTATQMRTKPPFSLLVVHLSLVVLYLRPTLVSLHPSERGVWPDSASLPPLNCRGIINQPFCHLSPPLFRDASCCLKCVLGSGRGGRGRLPWGSRPRAAASAAGLSGDSLGAQSVREGWRPWALLGKGMRVKKSKKHHRQQKWSCSTRSSMDVWFYTVFGWFLQEADRYPLRELACP